MPLRRFLVISMMVSGCGPTPGGPGPGGRGPGPNLSPPVRDADDGKGDAPQSPILYNGGHILSGAIPVYFIYYGNWTADLQGSLSLLEDFTQHVAGTPWLSVVTAYQEKDGTRASDQVYFAGRSWDSYSHGSSLSTGDIFSIVSGAIARGDLPLTPAGVYFVVTSPDVAEESYCKSSAAWHFYGNLHDPQGQTVWIEHGFIGHPNACPNFWPDYASPSTNDDPAGDAMVNAFAHELVETITDPFSDAWFDSRGIFGGEMGDKCEFSFNPTFPMSNGARGNVSIPGDRTYLLQHLWAPGNPGGCVTALANDHIEGIGGKCIDDERGVTDSGNKIQLWDCNGSAAQRWTYTAAHEIKGIAGKCLDVTDGAATPGTPIQLFDCNGSASQQWTRTRARTFVGKGNLCLDAQGGRSANGTQIELWTCNGTAQHMWSVTN
jgi:hypothetical protein